MIVEAIPSVSLRNKLISIFDSNIHTVSNRGKTGAKSRAVYIRVANDLGLRCQDILNLKKSDINDDGETIILNDITETKTNKVQYQKVLVGDTAERLRAHIAEFPLSPFVFIGGAKAAKPLTRKSVWENMKNAADELGIEQNVGTHSLRKSAALSFWAMGASSSEIKEMLNHNSEKQTQVYTGSRKYINQAMVLDNQRMMSGELTDPSQRTDSRALARADIFA